MQWHAWAFFASLALWIVAVLFVNPGGDIGARAAADGARQALVPWRNLLVTLLCAAIMSLGYSKLRLYLDEMTDALMAGRTTLDPYTVYGVNASHPEDNSTVARSVASCHDRTFGFLAKHGQNLGEIKDKLRSSVRMFIDDVSGWNNEIGMITRELRTATSPGSPPSATQGAAARRTQSADMLRIPTSTTPSPGAAPPGPGPQHPAGFKGREGRPALLLPKDRSHHKLLAPYNPEHGAKRHFPPQSYSADREMEDVDVFNAVRVPSPSSTRGSATFISPWSSDRVPKLGRHEGGPAAPVPKLEPQETARSEPPPGQPGPEPPKPGEIAELPREAIEFRKESTEQETRENISDGQLVALAKDDGKGQDREDNKAGSSFAERAESQETRRAHDSSWGQLPMSDDAGRPPPDKSSRDTEGT